jgi:hypothetical protein
MSGEQPFENHAIEGSAARWGFRFPTSATRNQSQPEYPERGNAMRKTLILFTTAVLLAGTAVTGSAIARDRSDRTELTAGQISDRAVARAARMKADLRLTQEQEKNWQVFDAAVVDMWKKQAEQRIAWRNARATQQQGNADLIADMRKEADEQIDRANARKKLADAAQPLYSGLDDQQKRRFYEALFRRDRDRRDD